MTKHHISVDTSKIFPAALAPTPIPPDIAARFHEAHGMDEANAKIFAIKLVLEAFARTHPFVGISTEIPTGYRELTLAREDGRHWRR